LIPEIVGKTAAEELLVSRFSQSGIGKKMAKQLTQ
jgi:hypothetical protein